MCNETSLLLCFMEIPFVLHKAPHVCIIFQVLVSGSLCVKSLGTAVAPEDVQARGCMGGEGGSAPSAEALRIDQVLPPRPWGQHAGAAGQTRRGSGSVPRQSRREG